MKILYVQDRTEWRRWLKQNGAVEREIYLRYFKKGSGKPRIAYEDAVNEALCYGWIDGIVRKESAESFLQRFTPRRPGSRWSAINVRRAQALIRRGEMTAAGHAVFHPERKVAAPPRQLPVDLQKRFRRKRRAWKNFQRFPPSYRRMAVAWVASGKKEDTRLKRFQQLVDYSEQDERIRFM